MIEFNILGLFDGLIFTDIRAFVIMFIMFMGIIGAFSKSVMIALFSAYLTFIHIVSRSDITFFENILYVVIVSVVIILAIRIVSFARSSNSQGAIE